MICQWRNDPRTTENNAKDNKQNRKIVAGLRPIHIFMGVWTTNLLLLTKEFHRSYNSFITESTITVLLALEYRKANHQ